MKFLDGGENLNDNLLIIISNLRSLMIYLPHFSAYKYTIIPLKMSGICEICN